MLHVPLTAHSQLTENKESTDRLIIDMQLTVLVDQTNPNFFDSTLIIKSIFVNLAIKCEDKAKKNNVSTNEHLTDHISTFDFGFYTCMCKVKHFIFSFSPFKNINTCFLKISVLFVVLGFDFTVRQDNL